MPTCKALETRRSEAYLTNTPQLLGVTITQSFGLAQGRNSSETAQDLKVLYITWDHEFVDRHMGVFQHPSRKI